MTRGVNYDIYTYKMQYYTTHPPVALKRSHGLWTRTCFKALPISALEINMEQTKHVLEESCRRASKQTYCVWLSSSSPRSLRGRVSNHRLDKNQSVVSPPPTRHANTEPENICSKEPPFTPPFSGITSVHLGSDQKHCSMARALEDHAQGKPGPPQRTTWM